LKELLAFPEPKGGDYCELRGGEAVLQQWPKMLYPRLQQRIERLLIPLPDTAGKKKGMVNKGNKQGKEK
jgi:hypothetical protein